MNEKIEIALAALILIAFVILIPFGMAVVMHNPEPYRVIGGEPIKEATIAAGLSVCNSTDILMNLPGATGGRIYFISDDCASPRDKIIVETQAFDSEVSRDAAIIRFYSGTLGKSKSSGQLVACGQYLVYTNGNSELFSRISKELKKI